MKILYVENEQMWHEMLRAALDQRFEVVSAFTLVEARRHFVNHGDIDVVVVNDGIERELDTLEFVAEIRPGFSGVILTCSSDCNLGATMVRAGCDEYEIKSHLAKKLVEIASKNGKPALV